MRGSRAGILVGLMMWGTGCGYDTGTSVNQNMGGWTKQFEVPPTNFTSTGRSAYFVLEPGYTMTYEGVEDGAQGRLVVTVLDRTKVVDGVETRVVEEREWSAGKIVEVSRNYFAIDKGTGDVYYFGEEVDSYKNGELSGHVGSWLSGVNGAHYGMALPGSPRVGEKYFQEVAPKDDAMDRAEVVSTSVKKNVPAGEFSDCVRTEEASPAEPGTKEYKLYAPGVGLIEDGGLRLVSHSG